MNMIKTAILTLALLTLSFGSYSSGIDSCDIVTGKEPSPIFTLIINADVTVVLVSNEQASLEISGDRKFMQLVSSKIAGDTLMITAAGNTYLMGRGTIYVPARHLRNIHINSGATVRSYASLQVPTLNVIVNGACTLAIANMGTVNIRDTKNFSVEQSTEVRPLH
jgi:hypothetical protein